MDYIAILHKDDGSDYGVSFPDFPGCITAGSTLDEAKDMAAEALALHIEGMKEDGENITPPSSLGAIMKDPDFADGVGFLVSLKQPDKTVRVNITMSESELAAIDGRAEAQGMKRSQYLVKSALARRSLPPPLTPQLKQLASQNLFARISGAAPEPLDTITELLQAAEQMGKTLEQYSSTITPPNDIAAGHRRGKYRRQTSE